MVKCFKFLFLNIIFLQVLAASLQSQIIEPKFDVLPVVTPRCIFQDSFGFIWIGTFGGMLRYDGYTLKHYSNIPYDSTSLSNNWVFAINEDKSGNLWIGTIGGGLNYFDRRTEIFTHYNSQTLDSMGNAISSIIVNEDGSLWLGSGSHGLIWFSKDPSGKIPDGEFISKSL
jgi:ligand-binding sensor domain-containing protein